MSVATEWKNTSCVIISGLRGEVALNEGVIFLIVNDLVKAFAVNSAALYIKMGRPGCEVSHPVCPKGPQAIILKILTDHLQVLQVITS